MQARRNTQLAEDLGQIFGPGVGPRGDRALLADFAAGRDAGAFEALVVRHGPMVRGVCRRVLDDSHDADDAFQATFLVLLLKGKGLADADRLAPWLYGVATRVAAKARVQAARRRARWGGTLAVVAAPTSEPDRDLADVLPLVDAEVAALPPKLRDAVVLCLVEGVAIAEAARRLGCPAGTVKSRLARGRDALRARLIGRGVAPALALAAPSSLAPAPVAAPLLRATVALAAAWRFAPTLLTLTRGVAPAMITKSTALATLVLGGILLAGGTAITTWPKAPALAQQPGGAPALAQQPGAPGPAPAAGDPAALRRESLDHVKNIMLAFHNYLSAHNQFPPAATSGADGNPKLSWRVALLPFLEETELYQKFRQHEPWDSPHNRALIPLMPAVYATPDSPVGMGLTRFRGFSGPGAMFQGTQGTDLRQTTDGASNTIMVATARDPVIWTQPGELPYVPDQPLPELDDHDPMWSLSGLVDGSALYLPRRDKEVLRRMITRNGGEVVSRVDQPYREAPPAESVEQRLIRLEEKLDQLIRKVDSQPNGAANR